MNQGKNKKRFAAIAQVDVPQGRNGKHKTIVSAILSELSDLKDEQALQIPLDELSDSKENVRSALNRASHKLNQPLATAAEPKFLYVWRTAGQAVRDSSSVGEDMRIRRGRSA